MMKGTPMNRSFMPPRVAKLALPVMLALLALAAAGCGHKINRVVDPHAVVEGRLDTTAVLLVWPDTPVTISVWADSVPVGPAKQGEEESDKDNIISTFTYAREAPGVLHTMVLDHTNASGYQMFRRSADGGFEAMTDYTLLPSRKWLSTQWELYELTDRHPSTYSPATYLGRGLLSGVVGPNSPMTNEALFAGSLPTATITYQDSLGPADSLFRMTWSSVPGAAGYWVHVYQFRNTASNDEVRQSGTPAPIWNGRVKDQFVGYVPAAATPGPFASYTLGGPGARVLMFTPPIHGQEYLVRVTAVDPNGRVTAFMGGGRFDDKIEQGDGTYNRVSVAATRVTPSKGKAVRFR
jgi:hypothetical protein